MTSLAGCFGATTVSSDGEVAASSRLPNADQDVPTRDGVRL
jgi:hypothetical protein